MYPVLRRLSLSVLLVISAISYAAWSRSHRSAQKQSDGLVKVEMGDVFERGETKIEEVDLATLPSLPPGFAPLNGKAYRVTTTAVVSGPYDAIFKVNSVTEEQAFNNLRVMHVEPDEFDPDSFVWIDRTAASEHHAPARDFRQRTIVGHSEELDGGVFMVARMVRKLEANADLEVTAKGVPQSVQMPATLGLTVKIENRGPQVATDVGVLTSLPRGEIVSAKTSQGTCKDRGAALYCKLGEIAAGSSVTIEVGMDPTPEFAGEFTSSIKAAARETDSNPDNNRIESTVLVLADSNVPPEVTLRGLENGPLLEQGAMVQLHATAGDSDGSVTKVEFFDNYQSIGSGSSTDARQFSITSKPLANGRHSLVAVATDNGGRTGKSNPVNVFVNGPIKVKILEPKAETLVKPDGDLMLTAEAVNRSGSIKSVEFFFTHNTSLGVATATQDNRFTLKLRDLKRAIYDIEARATDESGLISKSAPIRFTASYRPVVRISAPAGGASLTAPANIEVSLDFETSGILFSAVEIYANDVLIKKTPESGSGKYSFNWTGVKPGKYMLKAVVIDDLQTRGESSPVNIIVKDGVAKNQ
jgi:hypothetical protein